MDSKLYFKVINYGSNSYQETNLKDGDYQYKIGLNIAPDWFTDCNIFGPSIDGDNFFQMKCFRFTTAECIDTYFFNGNYLATVELPVDDPDFVMYNKEHANMIIINNIYPLSEVSTYHQFGFECPSIERCAYHGYFNLVKYWIENGVEFELKTYALSYAIRREKFEIVKYLLNNDVLVSDVDDYSLALCSFGMAKFLFEVGVDNIFDRILWKFVMDGNLDAVKYSVENNINVRENKELLMSAAEQGHLDIVEYFVENGADIHMNDDEILVQSAKRNRLNIVEYLVKNGSNIHVQDNAAVKISAMNGHLDVVKYLVDNGADIYSNDRILLSAIDKPNVLIYLMQKRGDNRNDIIYLNSINKGYLDVVKYFLENHIYDIHYQNDFALVNSIFSGNIGLVKYLVENGADVAVDDNLPLKLSVKEDKIEIAQYLLRNGADINRLDNEFQMILALKLAFNKKIDI